MLMQPQLEDAPKSPDDSGSSSLPAQQIGAILVFLLLLVLGLAALKKANADSAVADEDERARAFIDCLEYDDEPLDDEDRATIAEAANTTYITLDEYFERRAKRAS
jgi:hypothetical protein